MADLSSVLTPSVAPDRTAPDDTLHVNASPESFGGLIASGEQKLGQGAEQASNNIFQIGQFKDKIDADYGTNNYTDQRNRVLYGDPSKPQVGADGQPILGPDGKPMPDTGYLGLTGRAAADQREATLQQLKDLREQERGNLKSPQAQLEFDAQTRRLYSDAEQRIGAHAETQYTSWAGGNADASAAHSFNDYVANLNNPDQSVSANHAKDYVHYKVTTAQLKSGGDPSVMQQAQDDARRELIKAQIGFEEVSNPLKAQGTLDKYQVLLGTQYPVIAEHLKSKVEADAGQKISDAYAGRIPGLPLGYMQSATGIESGNKANAVNGSHSGLAMFSPALEAKYGLNAANRDNPAAVAMALAAENRDNHSALVTALGHEPAPADYYLAHQQGLGGAVSHMMQPSLPAWQNMAGTLEGRQKGQDWAKQAIWGNMTNQMKAQFPGGVESVTSGDFSKMWAQRFYGQPIQAGAGLAPQPGQPGASYNRFGAAADFSETSKGNVIGQITSDPYLMEHPLAMRAAISHTSQIFEAQTAVYTDQERQMRMAEQAKKAVSEAAETNYMKQIHAPAPNSKPLNVQDIVSDSRLTQPARDRLIKQVGDTGAKDQTSYGPGFDKAMQMVHAPEGTPGRLTDPQQLYSRLGPDGDLSWAGVEKLRSEIDLKKTPEGNAEAEMKKTFLATAKAQITGTDEGLHLKDPKGDELYLKFMAQALPAYDEGRRGSDGKPGKSPAALLNPDSPDYVGKIISHFKRPMDQWFNDTIHDAAPVSNAKPAFDIASVKSLDQLVTAYRAGNVTKQQADAMAVSNGWASRKAAVPAAPVSQ